MADVEKLKFEIQCIENELSAKKAELAEAEHGNSGNNGYGFDCRAALPAEVLAETVS